MLTFTKAIIFILFQQLSFIRQLQETIVALITKNDQLTNHVRSLEQKLAVNSRNSHKPPSSDSPQQKDKNKNENKDKNKDKKKKKKRPKKPSDKKPGGQKGHKGQTLMPVDKPDITQPLAVNECKNCHTSLIDQPADGHKNRQVFDIPPITLMVTEYRAEVKTCPCCNKETTADFPSGVTQPVQYGQRIKAFGVYFMNYQLLPYERTTQIFKDLLGQSISPGTLFNTQEKCYHNLAATEQTIKEQVLASNVVHFDETGLSVNGSLQWLHTASTKTLTFYAVHAKRGRVAMDDIGILPNFKGTAVHDGLVSYSKYGCKHGLCNAHHQRELEWAIEQEEAAWAQDMFDCLLDIKDATESARNGNQKQLNPKSLTDFETRYDSIIQRAYDTWATALPPPTPTPGKRGRKKQTKAKNLLDRLEKNKEQVLRFMYDFKVPYDNNLAERDLRMMKLKLKISGTFRSQKGAEMFCRIRSYISTVKKQGQNILNALVGAINNKPLCFG